MGQSLVKNYIHITFSTKHRQLLIVGGYVDHVHMLCLLSKKITLVKLLLIDKRLHLLLRDFALSGLIQR